MSTNALHGFRAFQARRISDRFVQQAAHSPHAVAIHWQGADILYHELDAESARLARLFKQHAKGNNAIVAIHASRSPGFVAAVLACARSGLTFAALDAAYPVAKLLSMAQLLQPCLLVLSEASEAGLALAHCVLAQTGAPTLTLEQVFSPSQDEPQNTPEAAAPEATDLAYLLFTSGTTGTPKCIATGHAPLVHFVDWYAERFKPDAADRFSLLSGLGHDPVLRDIFVPLSVGASLCIPPAGTITQPAKLFAWLQASGISFVHATPQLIRLIAAGARGELLHRLRYVFSGGDALKAAHVAQLRQIAPASQQVNFYGTTETPQAMAHHVLPAAGECDPLPAGKAIADVELLVLEKDLRSLCATGQQGQIGIRSRYLSQGYYNDAQATAQKFIHSQAPGADELPVYLTGDLGYCRADGAVVVVGREDDQVKVRGFRIELAEVTKVLDAHPSVDAAVVLAVQREDLENELLAFLVHRAGAGGTEAVKAFAAGQLAAHMVPGIYIEIDSVPLLPNGKIDRAALLKLAKERPSPLGSVDEEFVLQAHPSVLQDLQRILRVADLDTRKSFVELGGDSLSFIQASMVIEEAIGALAQGWEKQPLERLLQQKRATKRFFSTAGTTVVARALCIVLVLLNHFKVLDILGSTTALFVISGWSFGKYQLHRVLKENLVSPILKTVVYIVIPSTLFNVFTQLKNTHQLDWPTVLMVNNYASAYYLDGGYWFINVLVHSFAVLALLFCVPLVRQRFRLDIYSAAVSATLLSQCLAVTGHLLQNGEPVASPIQKLWLLFLGMAIAHAHTRSQKAVVALLATGCLFDQVVIAPITPFPMLLVWLLIALPRVSLPTVLAKMVNLIAGASLFIYISHLQFKGLVDKTPLAGNTTAYVLAGVLGGILVWQLWDRLFNPSTRWLMGRLARIPARALMPGNAGRVNIPPAL